MKPVKETTPRLSTEGLNLILGGRTYGESKGDYYDTRFKMDLPPKLREFGATIIAASQLCALSDNAEAQQIYDAYGHDFDMLTRYRDAVRTCIVAAIRGRAPEGDKDSQEFLERLISEIQPIEHAPTLNLSAETLRLEPVQLLKQLKLQVQVDVDALVRTVALWLHTLVERDHVSVVERINPSAVRYHFFRMEEERANLGETMTVTGNLIVGRTTTTEKKTRVNVFNERRTHTVVGTEECSLRGYRNRVPPRIARFVDAIPSELRQFVSIIDGTVTHEEIYRKGVSSRVEVETRSVYVPDPAVVLFDTWALNGWGGSAAELATATYHGHPMSYADKVFIGSIAVTLLVAFLAMSSIGGRGAILVAVVGAILTAMSQIGLRIGK